MVFSFEITTPPNTTEILPLRTTLDIGKGVIRHWHILFPKGNWCEAPIRFMKGGKAILPINPSNQMKGDNGPFVSEEFIYIKNPPFRLDATTWNVDTQNAHTIYIAVTIMPLWTLLPYSNQLLDLMEKEEVRLVL